jgi:mono/diheme cytochrome c family protein
VRGLPRPVVIVVGTLVALPVLGLLALLGLSELELRAIETRPAFTSSIPSDSASIERGRHIARTRGCFGCHGQRLEGQVFTEEWPWVKRAVAPNLAAVARVASPAELEATIRGGIGRDGRALWSMPSYNFVHLSDSDVSDLIAFLRSAPVQDSELPRPALGFRARLALVRGTEEHMVGWVEDVPPRLLGQGDDPALVRGEYLAMTTCNECHGLDLRGAWIEADISPPDLAVVGAYSWDEFNTLLNEGRARDGRTDLGLMTMVAPDRFAYFTEQERRDLYAFLGTLAERSIPRGVPWRPSTDPE